ncbi:branched-chain amino acid ABC transporter permease [Cupriavidus basilensis]|uniref:Branched-chain amino acid ABC transporter permease n=1 Tax=Cupriavidus basilensis TaxID=68895 RepID=A0ABT6API8_9BURK|nr:branched-chain amino acid ABC transporter permease [Cupriavidus basilensis]MDF3834535.1 branched-chain amino acid ABC transporter permease [Cupriavidus basilensis]
MSSQLQVVRATRASRYAMTLLVAITLLLVSLPFWADGGTLRTATEVLYFLALAQLWNVLAGYGGLGSFGQQAFIGLGGYALVAGSVMLGMPPFLAILLGGVLCGLIAVPVSRLMFRLQGAYFAVGTWVVAEVFRLLLANTSWLGGGSGMSLTSAVQEMDGWWRDALTLWLAVLLGIGAIVGVFALLRSRLGLGLTALRDSEAASESLGVGVPRLKLWVYVLAAAGFGLVGGLIFLTKLRISPDAAFSINWTVTIVFIVVIGGLGTIEGPILGTLIYFLLRDTLADYGSLYLILFGALAIAVMLFMRQGLWGALAARFDLQLFPVQRRVRNGTPAASATAAARLVHGASHE